MSALDPSIETKEELKQIAATCFSEFGQTARFMVRNSALQEVG